MEKVYGEWHFLVRNRVWIWITGRHIPTQNSQEYPPGYHHHQSSIQKEHRPFTTACSPYDSVLGSDLALASRRVIRESSPSSSNILDARLSQSLSLLISGSGSRPKGKGSGRPLSHSLVSWLALRRRENFVSSTCGQFCLGASKFVGVQRSLHKNRFYFLAFFRRVITRTRRTRKGVELQTRSKLVAKNK